jgi:hypothetical protein
MVFVVFVVMTLLGACTRKTSKDATLGNLVLNNDATNLTHISDIQFRGNAMTTLKMSLAGDNLYVSGRPFLLMSIYMRDPQDPYLINAAANNIDTFSPDPPFGGWVADWYAGTAMNIVKGYLVTSGAYGASVINPTQFVEVERKPRPAANGSINSDIAFMWRGMAVTAPNRLLGFSQTDYIYTVDTSNMPAMNVIAKRPYSSQGNVCCVEGVAQFGNKIFVAMRSLLLIYDIDANGDVTNPVVFNGLKPVGIAATQKYLYIQSYSATQSPQNGVYVFDQTGKGVGFVGVPDGAAFAPTPTDEYILIGQSDRISVNKINW